MVTEQFIPDEHTCMFDNLFSVFIDSNKKVVYCLNWSKEDVSAAASREVPMTKQIIDSLSALGEAYNCLFGLSVAVLVPMTFLLTAVGSSTFYYYYFKILLHVAIESLCLSN